MGLCSNCRVREAKILQPHFNRRVCERCFLEDIVGRVEFQIEKYKMIGKNQKILLGVSGGKDSFVLLDVLVKLHDPSKIMTLTIVEGIRGYNRREEVELVKKYAREYGVESIVTSIKNVYGYSLDEIVEASRRAGLDESPCTFCGILRRRILNAYARSLKVDRTVTAHNLDDEVQTILINIIRGDYARLLRVHPLSPSLSGKFVHKVKPLREVYEWETSLYAYLRGYKFQEVECPYITFQPTLRAKIREMLYALEAELPGASYKLLRWFDVEFENDLSSWNSLSKLPECKMCGEPTSYSRELCKICESFSKLGIPIESNTGWMF